MKLGIFAAAALATAALPFAPALARDQVNSKDAITVDPHRSYIFYRATMKTDILFLREVTEGQLHTWQANREAAYQKARAGYEKALAQWQKADAFYRTTTTSERLNIPKPVKPDPVTPETFSFPPPELDNFVAVSAGPRVDEAGTQYSYLIAVEPGTYALYGNVSVTNKGASGTCLCMGSIRFEAPAGKIVDLGRISYPRIESHNGDVMRLRGPKATPTHLVTPPSAALALPARLKGLPVMAADLRAAGKMSNYYGIEIDRLPAIPGVLAYRRDQVIDLKGEGAAGAAGTP